jgi:hypothetical protein|nr:MAG TPA: holin protein [Caudoviricetes sp.]
MNEFLTMFIPIVTAFLGGSGVWAWIQTKTNKNKAEDNLILGVARYQIISLGRYYIDRGYILIDEYDDFYNSLYEPYLKFGGNGLAKKIFEEVEDLPMLPKGSDGRKTK